MDKQLKAGIEVEKEHTWDLGPYTDLPKQEIAKLIAQGHLTQDDEYYYKLRDAGLIDEEPAKKILAKEAFSLNVPPEGKTNNIWYQTAWKKLEQCLAWCEQFDTTHYETLLNGGYLLSMDWNGADSVAYKVTKPSNQQKKVYASGSLDIAYKIKEEKGILNESEHNIEMDKPDWWNEPSENIYAPGITKGQRILDFLLKNKVKQENGKFVFYHATPIKGVVSNLLRAGSYLEQDPVSAIHYASRDRGLKPDQIKIAKLLLEPQQIIPGIFPTLRNDISNVSFIPASRVGIYLDSEKIKESLTWSGHQLSYRTKYLGMNISIENRKGSLRKGIDADGKKWQTKMTWPYGYIRGTEGTDGDHLDCFLGPNRNSSRIFVIHQIDTKTGEYDEDKVMLGWEEEEEAKKAYLSNYNRTDMFGDMEMLTLDEFKDLAFNHKGKKITLKKEDLKESNNQLYAPNGKPSKLSPYLYHIVRTPQFKAWFGDWENSPKSASKCKDNNGEPLVVYHGTGVQFSKFKNPSSDDPSKPTPKTGHRTSGIYFSPSPDLASDFAGGRKETKSSLPYDAWFPTGAEKDPKTGRSVKPCFLNIRNPFILDFGDVQYVHHSDYIDDQINEAMNMGYDGGELLVIEDNDIAEETSQWIIFNAKNAKSVYNKGQFNPGSLELTEGKNLGDLYHFTKFDSVLSILTKDKSIRFNWSFEDKKYYLSLTRNKFGFKEIGYLRNRGANEVSLVFDGATLSNKYPIKPYLDHRNGIVRGDKEQEERLYLPIARMKSPNEFMTFEEGILKYIKAINIYGYSRSDTVMMRQKALFVEDAKIYLEHALKQSGINIPVNLILAQKEDPPKTKKKGILSGFIKESFKLDQVGDPKEFYSLFKSSYEKATGSSWNEEFFMKKASKWVFYGDLKGAIAIGKKRLPFTSYQIMAMFGDMSGVSKGLREFFENKGNFPVFSLCNKRIGDFLVNNFDLMYFPEELIQPFGKEFFSALGKGPSKIFSDGGSNLSHTSGESIKYVIGNRPFFKNCYSNAPEEIRGSALLNKFLN